MTGQAAVTLILLALFGLAGWFFWLDAKRRQSQVQAQADLQNRLLEKFASPQEVGQFLQTESGRQFLHGMTANRAHAGRRILMAIQIGVILVLVGGTVVGLGIAYSSNGGHRGEIIGSLLLALGAGFLISAGLSYRLSKTWGLLPGAANGE